MIQNIVIPLSDNREIIIAMQWNPDKENWYCEMNDETIRDIINLLHKENLNHE